MTSHLENRLLKCAEMGNLRKLQIKENLIDFSSNDYLGLARSSKLSASANGFGSTGSRLLTGNSVDAEDLEEKIAKFHGYEAGLLFNCGYMANVGLLSTVARQESAVFFDAKVHASTHDGIRLSRTKAYPFRHNDVEHLENRLRNISSKGDRFICIESIYSTDGSIAPLKEIVELARKYEANLIVDEAHAVGVCGSQGRGLVNEQEHVFAQVVTFGKALGTFGAIVLGKNTLIQALINFATSYIYTTALPFHTLAAIRSSYELFPEMEQERQHLQKLIQLIPYSSRSHIQSVPFEDNSHLLESRDFDVRALKSPTVRRGQEVVRICLHAFNTEDELNCLLNKIKRYRNG